MSGSQVFYMGDNGEVVLWDGTTTIETANYCVTEQESGAYGPSGDNAPSTDGCGTSGDTGPPGLVVGPIDYDIGYAQALRDVLIEIAASGKQNLVQWLEARLKDLP